jgi:Family of unknown function (DUF6088)
MSGIADKIMRRIRAHGRGDRVYHAKDFSALGSSSSIWQALSRLTKDGKLRRIGRGLYDFPRHSKLAKSVVPPNADAIATILGAVAPDDLVAAHGLGLTNAVPVTNAYLTPGPSRKVTVGGVAIQLKHAPSWLLQHRDSTIFRVLQALHWLGSAVTDDTLDKIAKNLTDTMRKDALRANVVGWMRPHLQVLAATT